MHFFWNTSTWPLNHQSPWTFPPFSPSSNEIPHVLDLLLDVDVLDIPVTLSPYAFANLDGIPNFHGGSLDLHPDFTRSALDLRRTDSSAKWTVWFFFSKVSWIQKMVKWCEIWEVLGERTVVLSSTFCIYTRSFNYDQLCIIHTILIYACRLIVYTVSTVYNSNTWIQQYMYQ